MLKQLTRASLYVLLLLCCSCAYQAYFEVMDSAGNPISGVKASYWTQSLTGYEVTNAKGVVQVNPSSRPFRIGFDKIGYQTLRIKYPATYYNKIVLYREDEEKAVIRKKKKN